MSAIPVRIPDSPIRFVNEAACQGHERPEIWFAFDPADIEEAKAICRTCPVLEPCLRFAVANREWGIWAATTDEERTSMRRRMARGRT